MRPIRRVTLFALAALAASQLIFLVPGPAKAQEQNLLANPSFEGPYSSYTPETPQELADCPLGVCSTAQMPSGWKPWWVKERPTDVNPEYKPAERNVPGNRVRSGDRAAQYFTFWRTHKSGLRQTLTVPANARLRFSVWGHAWLSELDEPLVSDQSGTVNMRVGIDPTGGTNPYSPAIVWSGFSQPFDAYQLLSVEAQAQGDRVTVFTFSAPSVSSYNPEAGFKHTDIYWDDASLVVIGGGAPPPAPVSTSSESQPVAPVAAVPFVPGPTSTPDAAGIIYAVVQPGDSLWAIAARSDLTLDEVLELNNLSRNDFVRPGDLIMIGQVEPGEVADSAAADETGTPSAKEEVEPEATTTTAPLATPPAVALVVDEDAGATVCLTAFDDANQNGQYDNDESLRPAVAFTISDGQKVTSNYVTDGDSEPFCIKGLDSGNYRVTRSSLRNEILTTPSDRSISVTEGSSLDLEFGSYLSDEIAAVASAPEGSQESMAAERLAGAAVVDPSDESSGSLVVVAVVVAVVFLVAVLVVILSARRVPHES